MIVRRIQKREALPSVEFHRLPLRIDRDKSAARTRRDFCLRDTDCQKHQLIANAGCAMAPVNRKPCDLQRRKLELRKTLSLVFNSSKAAISPHTNVT